MDRRKFMTGSAALAAGALTAPAIVRAATEISFYFPIAVGGPIPKIIDGYASVKAQITTKDQIVHPVEYRLQKSGKEWRIYDVLLEGVSMVKNYRDQFDEILAKSSYEKLVADLRAKIPQGSP